MWINLSSNVFTVSPSDILASHIVHDSETKIEMETEGEVYHTTLRNRKEALVIAALPKRRMFDAKLMYIHLQPMSVSSLKKVKNLMVNAKTLVLTRLSPYDKYTYRILSLSRSIRPLIFI